MKIASDKKTVSYPPEVVFDFVSDFSQFQSMLPDDKVENWKADKDRCSFRIKGMTDLGLRISAADRPGKIQMVSDGKVPFPFTMDIHIAAGGESSSEVRIEFDGEINPFMQMMVEKPLTNFLNMLVDKLATIRLDGPP